MSEIYGSFLFEIKDVKSCSEPFLFDLYSLHKELLKQ